MLGQHPVVNKLLLEMGCDVNAVDDEVTRHCGFLLCSSLLIFCNGREIQC